ncbi:MAG TPA: helix-turn-helix transcriptional regulator [Burkholderiales bacterium]|nr:helix-turn-helix transcriptional regulator [Burkholderiales bacterium]
MRDNGKWHNEMRILALQDPEVRAAYEEFKLEFEIAEQCKLMRQKMNISQEYVAKKMHSSKSAISRLESAKGSKHSPSISTLKKYAEAIGCHLEVKIVPNC